MFSASKLIKIKTSLNEDLGIAVTFNQVMDLGAKQLIMMMLNLKAHFIAIETCKLFKLPSEVVSKIFTDWALYSMDRWRGDEEVLADKIYERFNKLQTIPSTLDSRSHEVQPDRPQPNRRRSCQKR